MKSKAKKRMETAIAECDKATQQLMNYLYERAPEYVQTTWRCADYAKALRAVADAVEEDFAS
ncbi:MAG: hypothetical protein ACREMY_01795 [bacterium]